MLKKVKSWILHHRVFFAIIAVVLVVGGVLIVKRLFAGSVPIRYVTANVERGTLIASISGSGQVSASNQIDIKPKVAGTVVGVSIRNGQEVSVGAIVAQLDSSAARKAVRDAELNLESAELSLAKLLSPADALSRIEAENSLAVAVESKQKAQDDLKKGFEDGFSAVADVFLDLPGVMTGLHDILFNYSFNNNQWNIDYYANATSVYDTKVLAYKQDVITSYQAARAAYDKNFADYKATSRYASDSVIEALVEETYGTAKSIAEAIKNTNNLIQFYKDTLTEHSATPHVLATTHLNTLNTYTGLTNAQISSALSSKRSLQTNREAIINADRTIAQRTAALEKMKAGADPLDIRSARLTVNQRKEALADARVTLAEYVIRAPLTGSATKVTVKLGDTVSAGTTLATIVGKQNLAQISLNEVDVAKVQVGQKVTLTFDAVEGLGLTGQVVEIDTLGTVAQGVVSYNVVIGFDAQDKRIKSGMSVSAAIITNVTQNVLLVPSAAVKYQAQGGETYVEILENGVPITRTIVVGAANDIQTEVSGDVKEGEMIITQTITSATTANATQLRTGGTGIPGLGGFGGGGTRRNGL